MWNHSSLQFTKRIYHHTSSGKYLSLWFEQHSMGSMLWICFLHLCILQRDLHLWKRTYHFKGHSKPYWLYKMIYIRVQNHRGPTYCSAHKRYWHVLEQTRNSSRWEHKHSILSEGGQGKWWYLGSAGLAYFSMIFVHRKVASEAL